MAFRNSWDFITDRMLPRHWAQTENTLSLKIGHALLLRSQYTIYTGNIQYTQLAIMNASLLHVLDAIWPSNNSKGLCYGAAPLEVICFRPCKTEIGRHFQIITRHTPDPSRLITGPLTATKFAQTEITYMEKNCNSEISNFFLHYNRTHDYY